MHLQGDLLHSADWTKTAMRLSCRILALFDFIAFIYRYAVSINDSRGNRPRRKLLGSHVFNAVRRQRPNIMILERSQDVSSKNFKGLVFPTTGLGAFTNDPRAGKLSPSEGSSKI